MQWLLLISGRPQFVIETDDRLPLLPIIEALLSCCTRRRCIIIPHLYRHFPIPSAILLLIILRFLHHIPITLML